MIAKQPEERLNPVEQYEAYRFAVVRWVVLLLVALLGSFIYWRYVAEVPADYTRDDEHFKYGSIGSDSYGGIPYWVWRVMPQVCTDHLPNPDAFRAIPIEQRDGLLAYRQFGFLLEAGKDRPIGFSKRRVGVERVGLNCAVCHVSTVRVADGMEPAKLYATDYPHYLDDTAKDRVLVLGMPANTVNLQAYFQFLFNCAADQQFTVAHVMSQIDASVELGMIERLFYQQSVPALRESLLTRRGQLAFLSQTPAFGPGRVDTFNPYKMMVFGLPYDGSIGTADFPSLWNQRPREGMQLHWDGNNQSVFERNISASLGAGATPTSLDMPRMLRVAAWIGSPDPRAPLTAEQQEAAIRKARTEPVPKPHEVQIPRFPFAINTALAATGKVVYDQHCAACHDWQGEYVGKVVPIADIGTDPYRLNSFNRELIDNQNSLGAGQWWRFHNFRKTDGYANMPLDGLWARAPYLHNGSVPTLADLLTSAAQRPTHFYRGDDSYDPVRVGFRSDRPVSEDGRDLFLFKIEDDRGPIKGNGNSGHEYGTVLSETDRQALLEYLKTL